jgi:hypothetical protein
MANIMVHDDLTVIAKKEICKGDEMILIYDGMFFVDK